MIRERFRRLSFFVPSQHFYTIEGRLSSVPGNCECRKKILSLDGHKNNFTKAEKITDNWMQKEREVTMDIKLTDLSSCAG